VETKFPQKILYIPAPPIKSLQVTDENLHLIESGGLSSGYWGSGLSFFFFGAGVLVSLILSQPTSENVFRVVLVTSITSIAVGVALGFVWFRARRKVGDIIENIRAQKPRTPFG
jgi:NhaP-type Na+/H+ or K+/H+ antiporter